MWGNTPNQLQRWSGQDDWCEAILVLLSAAEVKWTGWLMWGNTPNQLKRSSGQDDWCEAILLLNRRGEVDRMMWGNTHTPNQLKRWSGQDDWCEAILLISCRGAVDRMKWGNTPLLGCKKSQGYPPYNLSIPPATSPSSPSLFPHDQHMETFCKYHYGGQVKLLYLPKTSQYFW